MWKWFGVYGWRDAKNGGFDAVSEVFVLLTGGASFDIFGDPWPGSGPEIFFVDAPDRFISSMMTVQGSLVPRVHDFAFQALIWWNYKSLSWSVSPEWFVWAVHTFDGEGAFPFFHKVMVIILDNGDEVFQWARRVCVSYLDEYGFGEYDHLLIVVFSCVGPWGSGKGICSCVILSGYMMESEMVILEFSVPSSCVSV
jgi:hypothetical protein